MRSAVLTCGDPKVIKSFSISLTRRVAFTTNVGAMLLSTVLEQHSSQRRTRFTSSTILGTGMSLSNIAHKVMLTSEENAGVTRNKTLVSVQKCVCICFSSTADYQMARRLRCIFVLEKIRQDVLRRLIVDLVSMVHPNIIGLLAYA